MKLIVGLGNPGKEYDQTRHNVGFQVLDYVASVNNIQYAGEKFDAIYASTNVGDEKVLLIKPQRYMNLSGEVVKKYKDYYKLNNSDILVIQDDMTMVLGKIRIGYDSSSGGHNGIKNIESNLGNREYTRLKIGISNDKNIQKIDFVLGKFSKDEMKVLSNTYKKLGNIINDFVKMDIKNLKQEYASKNEKEMLSRREQLKK